MNDDTTDPAMVSLGRVFTEIRDMRQENKKEHKSITATLNTHSVQLACLETKWATFWKILKWAAPLMGAAIGTALAVSWLVKGA